MRILSATVRLTASPTGVATQSPWLMRGLDPTLKSARAANYVRALRGESGS